MFNLIIANMLDKILKRIPLAMMMIGKRRSGKTHLLIKMLNNKYFRNTFDNIYVFSPTVSLDETWENIKNEDVVLYDNYNEEIITDILKLQQMIPKDKRPDILIVLDDFAEKLKGKRGNVLELLATKGRHFNCSFIFTSQKYNSVPTIIRNNSDEIVFFKVSNNQELKTIVDEQNSTDLQNIGGFENLLIKNTNGYDYLLSIKGKADKYYRGNNLNFVKLNINNPNK